jgi:hypothetical protein
LIVIKPYPETYSDEELLDVAAEVLTDHRASYALTNSRYLIERLCGLIARQDITIHNLTDALKVAQEDNNNLRADISEANSRD